MNPTRKILLTGASGFLGSVLLQKAAPSWETVGLFYEHPVAPLPHARTHRLDLTAEKDIRRFLRSEKPDVIIHAAAQTRVDLCEESPEACRRLNEAGTRTLAEAASELGSRLLYISTDLVFDGQKGLYAENDPTHPLSTYARTKLAAERIVQSACSNFVVVRIAIMYGRSPLNRYSFSEWLRTSWEKGQPTPLFYDQYRTPIWVDNLAEALLELAEKDFVGVLHLAGSQRVDRVRFARILAQILGANKKLIVPKSMFDVPARAPRPKDVSLKIDRARALLKTPLLSVEDGLRLAYAEGKSHTF